MNNTEKYQKRQRIIPQEINKINIFPDHVFFFFSKIKSNSDSKTNTINFNEFR